MKNIIQSGFTLVELIMVIVVLGILSAVAIPLFTDLSTNASTSTADGIAGAISSASANNYIIKKAGFGGFTVKKCDAATLGSILQGGLPTTNGGVTVGGSAATTLMGQGAPCTVQYSGHTSTTNTILTDDGI